MSTDSFETQDVAAVMPEATAERSSSDRLMVLIVVVTLAATCWLISARQGTELGQVRWRANSVLHAVVELMALNYQYPTVRGVEIKWLTQGLGAAAALLAAAYVWFVRTQREEEWEPAAADEAKHGGSLRERLSQMAPASAGQMSLILFAAWMMFSAVWSLWPAAALGEGIRHLILVVWAIAIGRTLSQRGVRQAAVGVIVVLGLTGLIGVWYFYERNPGQRLKFPIGNPLFLAACLIPGITLACAAVVSAVGRLVGRQQADSGGKAEGSASGGAVALLAASSVAIVLMLWALLLTDARGAMLGLAGAIIVMCYLLLRSPWRWVPAGLAAAWGVVAWALQLWPVSWILSRPDTIRFRLYTWGYARDLFLQRPDIGRGQCAYPLLAQQMSRPDAEFDPQAFAGSHLGHAHNEWLEILADLGAIGFALMVTALALTFWAAVVKLRRPAQAGQRWVVVGLLAALVALILEETTDVALRMPGLPVLFYGVIGLLWASSGPDDGQREAPAGCSNLRRRLGLGGALVAAVGIAWISAKDFQGALANLETRDYAEQAEWTEARLAAERAQQYRLDISAYLSSSFNSTEAGHRACRFKHDQIISAIQRLRENRRPEPGFLDLLGEDVRAFEGHFNWCVGEGSQLWSRSPMYPYVADMVGSAWLMRQDLAQVVYQVGLIRELPSYVDQARSWIAREYARDPQNAELALELLSLSRHESPYDQLNLLRKPLRRGLLGSEAESELVRLLQQQGTGAALQAMLQEAHLEMHATSVDDWRDPYAPETLRLASHGRRIRGEFEQAVELSSNAVELYEMIEPRFPAGVSYALVEKAQNLLLAYPDRPEDAVAACEEALRRWPERGPERVERELKQSLALFLLAAGRESEARDLTRQTWRELGPDEVDQRIAMGLGILAGRFMQAPVGERPERFEAMLSRCLELAPEWPAARELGIRRALEEGQIDKAREHLQAYVDFTEDREQVQALFERLSARFPDQAILRTFREEFAPWSFSVTQPASTQPGTTLPADRSPATTQPHATRPAARTPAATAPR